VKKYFALILILLAIMLFVFLYSDESEPSQSIRFALSTAPVSLDPRFATDAVSTRINRLIYRGLVQFDDNLRPVPDLATWEEKSPTHYRFHLNDSGRQFHNSMPLTAHDVKATYTFILDSKQASPHRGSLKLIKEISVIDADTLDFKLEQPDSLFPGRLSVGILPAALIENEHSFNKHPIGSGEFEWVKWPTTEHLYLKRRSDGQAFEFLEVKDPTVRVMKLIKGEVDLLQNNLSPELVELLKKRPEIKITQTQGSNFSYLGFNLQEPITKQFIIRQAIALGLNRQDIINHVLGNAARPASSFLLPPTHWAGHPDLPQYTYNPDKARTLLAQAGFTDANPLKLTYKTSNNPFRIRIATVIQQQLSKINIQIDLRTYDWGTFYGDIKAGRFQMYSLSWVGIKMPDIFRYVFHSKAMPPNGANRGRLNDPKIDALIEEAEQATTIEAGSKVYRALQVQLFETLPYIPLWYEDHILATRENLSGYTLAADGNYDGLKSVVSEQ
jgi:peptide/nickel transport system substrate-binding protein